MIKAIFITDYSKHYFERLIPREFGYKLNVMNPRKSEFLIFDSTDSVSHIHNHICGWYRPISLGEIPIFKIIEFRDKPAAFIPFSKEETENWLYRYYIDWERTAEEKKIERDVKWLRNKIDEQMYESVKDANPKIFALVKN